MQSLPRHLTLRYSLSLSSLSSSSSSSSWYSTIRNRRHSSNGSNGSNGRKVVLFDAVTKANQKAKASICEHVDKYDYLRDHMATQVVDRLYDIPRTFSKGLDLFCGNAHIDRALRAKQTEETTSADIKTKIERLIHSDIHRNILNRASKHVPNLEDAFIFSEDDELLRGGGEELYDVVVSSGGLHWVNDLPRTLTKIRKSLKADGVFIGCMIGGSTLQELRISMQTAEDERNQRIAPRISPMVHLRDVASLLSSAGFTMPTADYERLVISFKDMYSLMTHVKGMGESNALFSREIHYGRHTFQAANQKYLNSFGRNHDGDDGDITIPATFDVMYMIGWAPSDKQHAASRRGSGQVSLTDLSKFSSENVVPAMS